MKEQTNFRERYIQLVEDFITAIESGRTGAELEDIRKEIRILSTKLNAFPSVENPAQELDISQGTEKAGEKSSGVDTIIT
jgi:hypothetical protein